MDNAHAVELLTDKDGESIAQILNELDDHIWIDIGDKLERIATALETIARRGA